MVCCDNSLFDWVAGRTPILSDGEIVMGIFFHVCDNMMGHRRFSNDHYVDSLQNVPMHKSSSGGSAGSSLSSGGSHVQVGIVRAMGLVEAGPNVRPNTVTFCVFAVGGSNTSGNNSSHDGGYGDGNGSARSGGVAGAATDRELYVVEAGRHNSFEAIVLFLIHMVIVIVAAEYGIVLDLWMSGA
jgi:hypothetical protein